ncbi:TA system antitoxin ParD family protein [Nitrincola tapanii]|uniref:TA system antitoxin ParD family protein n=1 Tax=Nitrincola tapanii TaxID=1708751 RepID=UPI002286AA97|nr:hypothetical protein [Nitrincola tapanii]
MAGKQLHRSTAEQIEHWADIGRQVASTLSQDALLQVSSGLARVKVEPVLTPGIDPDDLFNELEHLRDNRELNVDLSHSSVKYQASVKYPSMLEQIASDGTTRVDHFEKGTFLPSTDCELGTQ